MVHITSNKYTKTIDNISTLIYTCAYINLLWLLAVFSVSSLPSFSCKCIGIYEAFLNKLAPDLYNYAKFMAKRLNPY